MNQPSIFVKGAVITSSLLLAGTFILYRTGVLDGLMASGNARPIIGEPTPITRVALVDTPAVKTPADPAADSLRTDPVDSARRARAFFGGSKSMPRMIELPESDTPAVQQSDTPNGRAHVPPPVPNVYMGGSKSGVFTEPVPSDSPGTSEPNAPEP